MTNKVDDPGICDEKYPVRRVFAIIGDKWTPVVVYCLSGGVKRFGELNSQIPGISKKMLTQVLRILERDGVVSRKVYPVVPPKTEYTLTPLGGRLHEPIAMICRWAMDHTDDLRSIEKRRRKSENPDGAL